MAECTEVTLKARWKPHSCTRWPHARTHTLVDITACYQRAVRPHLCVTPPGTWSAGRQGEIVVNVHFLSSEMCIVHPALIQSWVNELSCFSEVDLLSAAKSRLSGLLFIINAHITQKWIIVDILYSQTSFIRTDVHNEGLYYSDVHRSSCRSYLANPRSPRPMYIIYAQYREVDHSGCPILRNLVHPDLFNPDSSHSERSQSGIICHTLGNHSSPLDPISNL